MNIRNIIIPTVCALLIVFAGYVLFHTKTSSSVKDIQVQDGYTNLNTGSRIQTEKKDSSVLTNEIVPVTNVSSNTKKIMYATLHTNKGNITIELFTDKTPETVEHFVTLAQSGFYDGTKFHRVIKGFMSQGGDPLSKDDTKMSQWGTGGPGYKFNDEITSKNSNDVNTIAMANSGANTNGSQFFINAQNNAFLNEKHTVFGKITLGADVALAINSVATVPGDRPVDPVIIQSITLK